MTLTTNKHADLEPVTHFQGPFLEFDFPAFKVGVAEYREGPAGCSASIGKGMGLERAESSGQGGAFLELGARKIAAFTVVSAIGAIVDRDGRVVRGHRDPKTGERNHLHQTIEGRIGRPEAEIPSQGNTALTVLITNRKFDPISLAQMTRQVHSSMARAVQPFHTGLDGDVSYAVTTDEVQDRGPSRMAFGAAAAEVVWDAVLSILRGG